MKKKAFTLTELLVVVVIIGVLSAVVLPKFVKVLETRKTTEAESIMAAVRTEQEARCMLGKDYTADTTKLASLPGGTSKYYNYSLDEQGITATGDGYVLRMPSYTDGRVCCEGDCDKINKDYPSCDSFVYQAAVCTVPSSQPCEGPDCEPGPEYDCTPGTTETDSSSCACGSKTRTCQSDGTWGSWSECPTCDCTPGATETDSSSCTCGSKTRTCQSNGTWGSWSECPTCDCTPGATETDSSSCACGSKMRTCQSNGTWGEWSECPAKPANKICRACGEKIEATCNESTGTWNAPDMSTCKDASECSSDTDCEGDITALNWRACCVDNTDNIAECYRTCSRTVKGGPGDPEHYHTIEELYGGGTPYGGYAAAGYDWEPTGGICTANLSSTDCDQAQCTESTVGSHCCQVLGNNSQNGRLRTCIKLNTESSGGSGAYTEYYWCAVYDTCSLHCAHYTKKSPYVSQVALEEGLIR